MNNSILRQKWGSMVWVGLLASASGHAADFEYAARIGASYSDNVERTAVDEQSSGAGVVGIQLLGERDTGRLRYSIDGDVEYFEYFESGIDGQEFGRLSAQSSYHFVPDTFVWMLGGSFDQIREDLSRPVAPENLEDVVTLTTGPTLTARFGDAFVGTLAGHYTTADYSMREFDSETVGGQVVLGRQLSARSYIGIGGSFDDVSYTSDSGASAPDFERREMFVRLSTEGVRTTFAADLGYAEVRGADLDDSGPMARLQATRRLTPFISAFVGYTREFPTSDDAVFSAEAGSDVDTAGDASVLSGAPREAESADVGLRLNRPRTAAELAYTRRSESEVMVSALERDFDEVRASFTRLLGGRSTASLFARYVQEEIAGPNGDSDETAFGGELNFVFGRALGLEMRVEHRERDSDVVAGNYSELSGGIFLRYGSTSRLTPSAVAAP